MAAVTLLGAATFDTSNGSKTVTATPAANDLIVIVTAHTGNTAATAPTDDKGGTYTAINNCLKNTSADRMGIFIRDALISSATSTVFTHAPGTTSGGGLAVLKVTGMTRTGSGAAKQSAVQSNQAAAGTPTPAFSVAALTGNAVIGAVFNASNPAAMTPRASYTERVDTGYNTPASGVEVMSRDSGETATGIAWGGTSATAFCSIAVELDTTAAPQTLTPGLFTNSGSFFAATLSAGAVILTPSLATLGQVFFAPSIVQVIVPGLFTDSDTFSTITLAAGAVTLSPPLLDSGGTIYATAATAAYALAPSLLSNSHAFYVPAIEGTNSLQTLFVGLLANVPSFSGVSVAYQVLAPFLNDGETFLVPLVATWTSAPDDGPGGFNFTAGPAPAAWALSGSSESGWAVTRDSAPADWISP